MNRLLAHALFDMGLVVADLAATPTPAYHAYPYAQAASRDLTKLANRFAECRSDGDEELAMRDLYRLASRLATDIGYTRLLSVYEQLAGEPVAV